MVRGSDDRDLRRSTRLAHSYLVIDQFTDAFNLLLRRLDRMIELMEEYMKHVKEAKDGKEER